MLRPVRFKQSRIFVTLPSLQEVDSLLIAELTSGLHSVYVSSGAGNWMCSFLTAGVKTPGRGFMGLGVRTLLGLVPAGLSGCCSAPFAGLGAASPSTGFLSFLPIVLREDPAHCRTDLESSAACALAVSALAYRPDHETLIADYQSACFKA